MSRWRGLILSKEQHALISKAKVQTTPQLMMEMFKAVSTLCLSWCKINWGAAELRNGGSYGPKWEKPRHAEAIPQRTSPARVTQCLRDDHSIGVTVWSWSWTKYNPVSPALFIQQTLWASVKLKSCSKRNRVCMTNNSTSIKSERSEIQDSTTCL